EGATAVSLCEAELLPERLDRPFASRAVALRVEVHGVAPCVAYPTEVRRLLQVDVEVRPCVGVGVERTGHSVLVAEVPAVEAGPAEFVRLTHLRRPTRELVGGEAHRFATRLSPE